ncbi:MAG: hypothetical protein V3T77_00460, partial [Planctomycetota bacterium]
PGVLAKLLLSLEEVPAQECELIEMILKKLAEVHAAKGYLPLRSVAERGSAPDTEQARQMLLRQGLLLLDTLLCQKEKEQG